LGFKVLELTINPDHIHLFISALLLRWMMWEPKRVMNNKPVNALEAGFSRLQPWRASK
jgi:REP element-mobilizing transposase RayT